MLVFQQKGILYWASEWDHWEQSSKLPYYFNANISYICGKGSTYLRASVNLPPYSIYMKLGLRELQATIMILSLVDWSIQVPRRVMVDVLLSWQVLLSFRFCDTKHRVTRKGSEFHVNHSWETFFGNNKCLH